MIHPSTSRPEPKASSIAEPPRERMRDDDPWARPRLSGRALFSARKRHPYYIVAPKYVRSSAGIKVLHLLCHALNQLGEQAYLVIHPYVFDVAKATHPYLHTPLLDAARMRSHLEDGLCPITVYPETLAGNPFRAPLVVRYLLNFPGLLGGDPQHPDTELLWAYSESISARVPGTRGSLFIPASDLAVFKPTPEQPRSGSCFYASKYRHVHGGELLPVTRNSIEITRDRPDSQTPEEIADLFRRSEVFYCYENSALAIEALLCECPVVFLPNPYLDQLIGLKELGMHGMAWGDDPEEVRRAKATVQEGRQRYLALYEAAADSLQDFVEQTQASAAGQRYTQAMLIKYIQRPGYLLRLARTWEAVRRTLIDRGPSETWSRICGRLRREGFRLL